MSQPVDAGGGGTFSFAAPDGRKSHGAGGDVGTWVQKVRGGYGFFSRSNDLEQQDGWRKEGAGDWRDLSAVGGARVVSKEVIRPQSPGRGSPILYQKGRPLWVLPTFPSAQAQVVAKYRKEMMELVKGVPEPAYELSLRDLVEVPKSEASQNEEASAKREGDPKIVSTEKPKKKGSRIKNTGKKLIQRSASMDSGVFLLKMFFPPSLGARRRLSSSESYGNAAKVAPKPVKAETEKRRPEEVDAECLESELSASDEIKNRGHGRKSIGCYPFSINRGRTRHRC